MKRFYLFSAFALACIVAFAPVVFAESVDEPAKFSYSVEVQGDNSWAVKWSRYLFGENASEVEAAQYRPGGTLVSETTFHYRADQSKVRAVLSFDGGRPSKYEFFDDKDKLIRTLPIAITSKKKAAFEQKETTGVGEVALGYDARGSLNSINFQCVIDNTQITYALDSQGRIQSKVQNRSARLQKTQYFSKLPGFRKAEQLLKLVPDANPSAVFEYKYDARGQIIEFNGQGKAEADGEILDTRMLFAYDTAGRFSGFTAYDKLALLGRQQLIRNPQGKVTGVIMQMYEKGRLEARLVMRDFKNGTEMIRYGADGKIDERQVFAMKPYRLTLKEEYDDGHKYFVTEYQDGKPAFGTQYKKNGTVEWRKPVNPDGSYTFRTEDTSKTN